MNIYNFKYCVWLSPSDDSMWKDYTNGFIPHLTLHKLLDTKQEAFKKINKEIDYKVNVKLVNKLYQASVGNFYALECKVECVYKPPYWWPKNAHISFAYKYNTPFTKEDIQSLEDKIKVREDVLCVMRVVKCSGHYKNWSELKIE